jgi:hypothetical protein
MQNENIIFQPFYCLNCRKENKTDLHKIFHKSKKKQKGCFISDCLEKSTHFTRGGIAYCDNHKTITSFKKVTDTLCLAENCKTLGFLFLFFYFFIFYFLFSYFFTIFLFFV